MRAGKVELQPAYVLHNRPYRETSLLVDFITPQFGHVSAVAKGARGNRAGRQSLLQPFGRILVSWQGRNELKTLVGVEDQSVRLMLHGDALFSGMYANELLTRVLRAQDHCEQLFERYENLVHQLATQANIEPALRSFEMHLLEELGYAIPFPDSAATGVYYYAQDGHFIELTEAPLPTQQARCFNAEDLHLMTTKALTSRAVLRAAKRLMRLAFAPLLGGRKLRSRELFKKKRIEYERQE